MWEYNNTDELYHYGVLGMKWGRRMLRGHAGPGAHLGTTQRKIQKHKSDLDYLNKGGHLSIGFTKKRQAAYDARDKKAVEKRIAKLEEKAKRRNSAEYQQNIKKARKALIGTMGILTVSAAATVYATNPKVKSVVNSAMKKAGSTSVSALRKGGSKAVSAGKSAVKSSIKGFKEGVSEGIKEAPKKAGKAIIVGSGMLAAKAALDNIVGKEESAKIFKANNPKKIDSFWKVSPEDKD